MSTVNVWFVTGAGRGLGVDIARAALDAGHRVVATGRDASRVLGAIGAHDNLHTVTLDITVPAAAEAAADASGRALRCHRRAGQQRRQLPRGVLRDHQ